MLEEACFRWVTGDCLAAAGRLTPDEANYAPLSERPIERPLPREYTPQAVPAE